MKCKFCENETIPIGVDHSFDDVEEVYFCSACQRGWSIYEYDASLYGPKYFQQYLERADTDLGRQITLQRIGLIASFLSPKKKLLDFGCGSGSLLQDQARRHWECYGVEVESSLKLLYSHTSLDVKVGPEAEIFKLGPFDAVTFFDSLEHVPVEKTLQSIPLAESGFVFITIPELPYCFCSTRDQGYLERVFSQWRHGKPKEHLEYFTEEGLKRVLESLKFKIVHTTHQESFLRFDDKNPQRNILTVVAQKCS